MNTGTIYNTLKMQSLNNKWMQKKDSGDVLSKQEKEKRANWTADEHMVHNYQQQMISERENSKGREIANKVDSGAKLTAEEEQYLEQNDPEALKRYRESKAEKKNYEEKLRNCKTKDEVERLKINTASGYLASMKKIENDPYIPMSAKLGKALEILAKSRNMEEAELKFKASAEYENLPTEAEEAIEASKEREEAMEKVVEKVKEGGEETIDTLEESEEKSVDADGLVYEKTKDSQKTEKKKTEHEEVKSEIEDIFSRIKLNADLEDATNKLEISDSKVTGSKVDFLL